MKISECRARKCEYVRMVRTPTNKINYYCAMPKISREVYRLNTDTGEWELDAVTSASYKPKVGRRIDRFDKCPNQPSVNK